MGHEPPAAAQAEGGMAADGGNTLDGVDLLAILPPGKRAEIARQCRWKRVQAQEQIIDRQSESREVLFVVRGTVRIVIYSLSGRELTLDDLGAGQFFGELAAIDGHPRSASVMAVEETLVAALPGEAFLALLRQEPDLAVQVMRRLASMVRTSTDRIIELSTLGANNRVHAELLRQARLAGLDEHGQAVLKPIPVHADIASRVSTTRETVARVLNDLARRGTVRRDRDALVIVAIDDLETMVESVRGE
jgi:CRP-like cAMP-binding protein